MPAIHICSLKMVGTLAAQIKPSHVLSLLGDANLFPQTPAGIAAINHLKLNVADISAQQDGMITPGADHIEELIAFGRRWAKENAGTRPLLVHCFAGISRSTASALTIACALRPKTLEQTFADALRDSSASAQPNSLMIEHADDLLARNGRLIEAVNGMGLADFSKAGTPFVLRLDV